MTDELTRLSFPGDPTATRLPLDSYTTPYEKYYETLPVSAVGPQRLIGLPLLLERPGRERVWLAVTEADLTDYAGMYLSGIDGRAGDARHQALPAAGRERRGEGARQGPAHHALARADGRRRPRPPDRVESDLPPQRPAGDQGHFLDQARQDDLPLVERLCARRGRLRAGREHGDDEALHRLLRRARHPIPLARRARHRLVRRPDPAEGPTDVTKAAPSIDMPELLRYAKQKGVRLRLWMHWKALKPQIDEAFAAYERGASRA